MLTNTDETLTKATTYYRRARTTAADLIPANYQRVLEIGCAEGIFREYFRKDCEYWGVEPVADIALIASKKLHKVIVGTFEEAAEQLPDNYFDLVVCNDVIEHMIDHDVFLESIKQKLTLDASLIGSIPNVRYLKNLSRLLISKDWEYQDGGILDRTHLRFFTEKSLKRSFVSHGYDILVFRGITGLWKKTWSLKGLPKAIRYSPLLMILGWDTRFKQFGFQVKLKPTKLAG